MQGKPGLKTKKQSEFWFDKEAADKVVDFFAEYIHHTKGEWAGQPFLLQKWQKKNIRELFGWKRADGSRKYRTTYWEVPRKNGKSFLASAIGLYLLFADGEPGAEIYSAAAERDQASIVFDMAREIVAASPSLSKRAEIFRHAIVVKATGSSYKVLSADANTKYGYSVHGLLFDELMSQPNRLLWDALTTASGARRQPLIFAISTAGFDRNSICWEIHEYAQKVLDGTVNDPSFLPVLFGASDDDDWTTPKIWRKANPSYGVTVKTDYIKAECERAKVTPTYENTFRRLLLNQWTQQETRWLQMTEWDACAAHFDLNALKGRRCYAGLDLASTTDIAALVLVFPPIPSDSRFYILPFFWIPEDNMRDRVVRDRVPYDAWQRDGLIEATPGNCIDYRWIMLRIGKCRVDYDLKALAFDRWGSQQIVSNLCDEFGFTVDEKEAERFNKPILWQFGQGFASMSSPCKELLNLVIGRQIAHGGNPVLRWMSNNAVVKSDSAGNIKLDKGRSTEKIDGVVAMVMGLDLAVKFGNQNQGSFYDSHELRFL